MPLLICQNCKSTYKRFPREVEGSKYCSKKCQGNAFSKKRKITLLSKNEYNALHKWVGRKLGKAQKCSNNISHVSVQFQWANISGEYKRELSDWKSLCRKCHSDYDKQFQN